MPKDITFFFVKYLPFSGLQRIDWIAHQDQNLIRALTMSSVLNFFKAETQSGQLRIFSSQVRNYDLRFSVWIYYYESLRSFQFFSIDTIVKSNLERRSKISVWKFDKNYQKKMLLDNFVKEKLTKILEIKIWKCYP